MKKVLAILAIAATTFSPVHAQDYQYGLLNHLGIYAGGGSEGINFGVATTLTPYLEVSAGMSIMPSIKVDGDVDLNVSLGEYTALIREAGLPTNMSLNLEGDFKRTTFDVKASVYPFGSGFPFFVAGGLSFGGKELATLSGHSDQVAALYKAIPSLPDITAQLDDYSITVDRQGNVAGDIRVKSVRPYLGLGIGRLVPKHRVGFRFEAGAQFMGKIGVWQNDQELTESLTSHADDDLSKIIDKLTVYPVIRLTITGRLF